MKTTLAALSAILLYVLPTTSQTRLTQDWNTLTGVDQHFSLRLKDLKITDQKETRRCWMFSGLTGVESRTS